MSGKLKICTQYDILVQSDLFIPCRDLVFLFGFSLFCVLILSTRENQNMIAFVVCVVYCVHLRDMLA